MRSTAVFGEISTVESIVVWDSISYETLYRQGDYTS